MNNILKFLFLVFFSCGVMAASDIYLFEHPGQEQRFNELMHQFRCMVCQNQTLSDSNAPLAKDLREAVYLQIISGENDTEIIEFMSSRYGDFVLFKPPLKHSTVFLWFAPLVFLLFGFRKIVKGRGSAS